MTLSINLPRALWISGFIAAISTAATLSVWGRLPERFPMHFGVDGTPDGFAEKGPIVFLLPAMAFLVPLLIAGVTRLDTRTEHVARSEGALASILAGVSVFLAFTHLLVLKAAASSGNLAEGAMMVGMGLFFAALGLAMPKLKSNYFAGIRTPWTLSDERNWHLTHRLAGWTFVIGGLGASAAGLVLPGGPAVFVALALLVAAAFVPVVYSYALWRNRPGQAL